MSQFIYLQLTLAEQLRYYRDEGLTVHVTDFKGLLEPILGSSGPPGWRTLLPRLPASGRITDETPAAVVSLVR